MKSCVAHFFAIAGAVLLAASTLAWARSYWYADAAGYSGRSYHAFLHTAKGKVRFFVQSPGFESGAYWHPTALESLPVDVEMGANFRFERNRYRFAGDTGPVAVLSREFTMPLWSIVGMFLMLSAASVLWVRRARSRARLTAGLCPACGYDLRATPDRCPECGTVPAHGRHPQTG